MKKLFDKNEVNFALTWIGIYCLTQSIALNLNDFVNIHYFFNAIFCVLLTIIMFLFVRKNGLEKYYNLRKPSAPAVSFLYYIPLVILATCNLWNGVALNYSVPGSVCHVIAMLCVGYLEEMIFRGFLFKAMAKKNVTSAIIVSSVTFGIGHIVNSFNGSGMDIVNNILQIIFAIAVGFLFVIIFYRGGSILPCIITHSAINSLNTFSNNAGLSTEREIVHVLIMMAIPIIYLLILLKTLPKKLPDEKTDADK